MSQRERPLFPCAQCGRHIRRSESACPFCKSARPWRTAVLAAAFFGAAAMPACAYGPPPDDFTDQADVAAAETLLADAPTAEATSEVVTTTTPDGTTDEISDGTTTEAHD